MAKKKVATQADGEHTDVMENLDLLAGILSAVKTETAAQTLHLASEPEGLAGDALLMVVHHKLLTVRRAPGPVGELKAAFLDDAVETAVIERYARFPAPGAGVLTAAERSTLAQGGYSADARLHGVDPIEESKRSYARLLRESLTVAEAAQRLEVGETRIRQRLTDERTLYGVKVVNKWRLPRFQFTEHDLVPEIGSVLGKLDPELHPVAVTGWFATPHPDLLPTEDTEPLSPRDWLLAGHDAATVAALAEDL